MWALTLFFFFFTSLFNNLYIPSYSAKDALKSFEWSVTQLLLCSRCWQVLKRGIYFSFSGYQAHSKSTPLPKGGRLVVKCGTAFNTVESGTAAGTPGTFVVFFLFPSRDWIASSSSPCVELSNVFQFSEGMGWELQWQTLTAAAKLENNKKNLVFYLFTIKCGFVLDHPSFCEE